MAQIVIREKVWHDLMTVARNRRQRPEELAEDALVEYLQRLADEELLRASERAARRAKFRISDTESIVRKWRRNRKGA
jgi:hypothetical protein